MVVKCVGGPEQIRADALQEAEIFPIEGRPDILNGDRDAGDKRVEPCTVGIGKKPDGHDPGEMLQSASGRKDKIGQDAQKE
jgi:hypothetical protein